MSNKRQRGSGVKNRGNRNAVNASGPSQKNVRGSGAKNRNNALQVQEGSNSSNVPKSDLNNEGNKPQQSQQPTLPPRPKIPSRNLRYPLNEQIHDNTDYLKIDIVEYKPIGDGGKLVGDPGSRRTNGKNILHSIILPIPPNVQDGNAVSYSDSSLNGLTAALAGGSTDLMKGMAEVMGGDKKLNEVGGDLNKRLGQSGLDMPTAQDLITKKLAASAAGVFGGNVSLDQLLARQEGNILNPNMELLFNGPTLRSFRFSFKMTPRSQPESRAVRDIINTFKRSMAPKTVTSGSSGSQNLFLKTPDIFELKYMQGGDEHSFLHKFKQCFLENMSVNYTAEGTYASYEDGTPISLVMNLSFKELEPIYDIDYDDDTSGEKRKTGVGF